MPYHYNGSGIFVPAAAEVSAAFQPREGAAFRDEVQYALNSLEPWEKGEDPIYTFNLPREIGARVVELTEVEFPLWGINPHHKARSPGVSPFFILGPDDPRRTTRVATLELTGTVGRPILTRVYPGEYMPPLPWMQTASKAPEGKQECIDYWNAHAFILRTQRDDLAEESPRWYTRK